MSWTNRVSKQTFILLCRTRPPSCSSHFWFSESSQNRMTIIEPLANLTNVKQRSWCLIWPFFVKVHSWLPPVSWHWYKPKRESERFGKRFNKRQIPEEQEDKLTNSTVHQMAQSVHAVNTLSKGADCLRFGYHQFRIDVFQIPFEWLALETFTQFQSVLDAETNKRLTLTCSALALAMGLNQLTFQMKCSWPMAPPHNNIVCNRPSTLRRPVVYSLRKHFHCHRGTCTDAVCGRRDQHDCMELSLSCHRIARLEKKFPNFHRLKWKVHPSSCCPVDRPIIILLTPNIHFHVIFAQFFKIFFIYHKQTAGNHRRSNGRAWILLTFGTFLRTQVFPFENLWNENQPLASFHRTKEWGTIEENNSPNSSQSHLGDRQKRQCTGTCPCWWHQWRDKPLVSDPQRHVRAMVPANSHCTHSDCPRMSRHWLWLHLPHSPVNVPSLRVSHSAKFELCWFSPIRDHPQLQEFELNH